MRFLLVGGLNTLFGYGMFSLFIFLGLHYSMAVAVAMVINVLFNFLTTSTIVFKNRDPRLIARFVAVYGVVYAANVGGLRGLHHFSDNNYICGAILVLPVALLAFTLQKKFVFNKASRPRESA